MGAGFIGERMGDVTPMRSPYEAFKTRDGAVLITAGNDKLFAAVCEALGLPALPTGRRFDTNVQRLANRPIPHAPARSTHFADEVGRLRGTSACRRRTVFADRLGGRSALRERTPEAVVVDGATATPRPEPELLRRLRMEIDPRRVRDIEFASGFARRESLLRLPAAEACCALP